MTLRTSLRAATLLLAGGLALAATATPAAAAGTTSVSGTVTSARPGVAPLVGVAVTAYAADAGGGLGYVTDTTTDLGGRYTVSLPAGVKQLYLQFSPAGSTGGSSPTGYAPACYGGGVRCWDQPELAAAVRVATGAQRTGVDIGLLPAAQLRGRVTDTRGAGVAQLPILVGSTGCDVLQHFRGAATTDSNGYYLVQHLGAESQLTVCVGNLGLPVTVAPPAPYGYVPTTTVVTTLTGRTTTYDPVLVGAGAVAGRLVDTSGAPVAGTVVIRLPNAGSYTVPGYPDASGAFQTGPTPPGHLTYCVVPNSDQYVNTCRRPGGPLPTVDVRPYRVTQVGTVVVRSVT